MHRKHYGRKNHSVNSLQSIRTKLILFIILLSGIMFLVLWLLNYLWLAPYYEHSKITMLAESFSDANRVIEQDENYAGENKQLSEDSQLQLEIIAENSSVTLYVFRVANYFGNLVYNFDYPRVSDMQQQTVEDLTESYLYASGEISGEFSGSEAGRQLVQECETYNIFKVYDKRINSNYLELFGELESGSFVYLRANYQSMNENVGIFNRFVVYTGSGVLILGILLMVFWGNHFARPIVKLTDIAQKMSELDFHEKYPVTTQDEIGVLGSSINMLSEKLEMTISELKAANNELQKDIENKVQIDEMRKEFLSNVSHELKTPIALIQGYAEGLQDNINDDKESREFYCEVIIDEAQKMNKMVKKLLTLNQIEFGKNQISFDHFDIVGLVQSVVQSATLLAEQKQASITFDREYEPIYVWADEYMVEEVVTNYISNAINHVDYEKRIEVSMEIKEELVRISVFNTGNPIPEEDIDKVWIKFYKVDKARTREYGGSGIGLSIVKAIMDSMNREYGVENRENGVCFWFELDRKT